MYIYYFCFCSVWYASNLILFIYELIYFISNQLLCIRFFPMGWMVSTLVPILSEKSPLHRWHKFPIILIHFYNDYFVSEFDYNRSDFDLFFCSMLMLSLIIINGLIFYFFNNYVAYIAVFGYYASVNDCAHFSYGYSFDIYWYLLYLLLFMVFLISVYSHGNYFSVYYGILFFFGVFDYFSMLWHS